MTVTFSEYISMLADAVSSQQGPHLAHLLRPTSLHGKDILKEFRQPSKAKLAHYKGSVASPWDEIAIAYVLVVFAIAQSRPIDAFREESQLISLFFRFLTSNNGWTLSALFAILRDLRDIAHTADNASQKTECMEEAARIISKAFTHCVTDRFCGLLQPDHALIYSRIHEGLRQSLSRGNGINRISLCRNILRALNANPDIPPLAAYPRAHQVTFHYYLGIINFLNEDYDKSEQELTSAFNNCHVQSIGNQQRILMYLIPLRLLRGFLPSKKLLDRFPLLNEVYSTFITAIRNSDVKAYDLALYKWERRLVEFNVWLVFERTRELVMRGLFRRVWVASNRSTRIPIHMFHCAVRVVGMRVDVEEVECFVANMIHRGLIKGYISHEKQMVVLASNGAFPRLSDCKSSFLM